MSYIEFSWPKGVQMNLKQKQLSQIVRYNTNREYFGIWTPGDLSDCFKIAKKSNSATTLHVGKLTDDIICDTLWCEMSLNPTRFGTESPFKTDNKNSIIYFTDTFRNKILFNKNHQSSKNVMNLIWKAKAFIQNLYNAKQDVDFTDDIDTNDLYKYFITTGNLPTTFRIFDNNDTFDSTDANAGYRILGSLCGALRMIAAQNWEDLSNPIYSETIKITVMEKYPNGERSDTYPVIQQPKAEAVNQEQILENQQEKVIQLCLPFENSGR